MKVGTLEIEMLANLARLRKDMDDAKGMVGQAMSSIEKSVNLAKTALGALGIGLGVGYFANLVKSSIDATAKMKDLAQEAGVTAETISKFEAPARTAGLGLDTVAAAMFKLNKAATEAKDPNSRAAQALNAIGISTAQLKNLKPDEMFELVARAAAKYGDGIQKNAVMTELFNKSGREMNRMVAELAETQTLAATTTNKQAEEADRLQDQMIELTMESEKLKRAFLSDIVPAASEIVKAFAEAKKEGGLLQGVFAGIEASWQAMKGTTTEQLARINKLIATQRENVAQDPKHQSLLNDYLAERARLEKIIFDQELEAQNKRALAGGGPGKPDPKFDPEAMARAQQAAQAFRGELASLEKQLAGVVGQGEAEAYALKLQGDSFKNLTPYQKYYLQTVNDVITAEKQNAITREELIKSNHALIEAQDKINELVRGYRDALRDAEADLEFENSLIGKSADEIARLTKFRQLDLDLRAKAAQLPEDASSEDIERLLKLNAAAKERIGILMDTGKAGREQVGMWEQISDAGGKFFSDLLMNGKSAFDRLRDSLKQFVAELLAAMAKRYILNIATNGTSTFTSGNPLVAAGMNSPLGLLTTVAAAGYGLGSFGAGALGAGEKGQKVGGITGMLGGGLIGAIIGKFTDPNGLAQRTADFGGGRSNYWHGGGSSAFGSFGVTNDKWFSDADMLEKVKTFQTGLATAENALAKYLTTDQIAAVTKALANSKNYNFGTEHGDFAGTLGQILSDRINTIVEAVDPALKKWLDGFTGTGDELAAYAETLLQVRQALDSADVQSLIGRIPDLTIDGLMAMKQAGESLADTFKRVVGDFLTAEANLNSAIGARNPQFARDLVLSQRNAIAQQFASSTGGTFGDPLLMQMALNPQAFGGLNTLQMGLLAQFLGLQTQLEQLDAQLANSTTPALASFTQTVIDSTSAMAGAIGGLTSYLRGSLLGDLSPLSPEAKYAEARRQYQANLALAQGGDVNAIGNFGATRDAFLNASRAVYASSGQYNTDFFSTFNAGAALTGGAVGPLTGAQYAAGNAQTVAAVQANTSATLTLINLIAAGISMNDPEAVAALHEIKQTLVRGNGVTL